MGLQFIQFSFSIFFSIKQLRSAWRFLCTSLSFSVLETEPSIQDVTVDSCFVFTHTAQRKLCLIQTVAMTTSDSPNFHSACSLCKRTFTYARPQGGMSCCAHGNFETQLLLLPACHNTLCSLGLHWSWIVMAFPVGTSITVWNLNFMMPLDLQATWIHHHIHCLQLTVG